MTDTPSTAPGAEHPLNRHLFIADNIYLLRSLDNGTVDLVVTDPPFGKGRTFTSNGLHPPLTSEELSAERAQLAEWGINDRKSAREAGMEWSPNGGEASYDDIWYWQDVHEEWADQIEKSHPAVKALIDATRLTHSDSHAAYLSYMAIRLLELRRVLKPSGSIYLHCDPTASHYLKLMMDTIFGKKNFRNEIIWAYTGPSSPKIKQFPRKHDAILWYSNGKRWTFNRDDMRVPYKDPKQTLRKALDAGRGIDQDEVERYRERGKIIENWWEDIALAVRGNERTGYPTQKPVALAERIIKASSNPGDVVLDPFAGCAYVPVSAEGLGRQWIACDISVRALTVVKRQFNKFRYSVDGGPVIVKKNEISQQALLADCDVTVRGPGQLPKRADEDPDPPPPLVLEEPVYKGQLFTRKEMLEALLEDSGWMCWCCGSANRLPDGKIVETTANFELDHIDPKFYGGGDSSLNRDPLCRSCNGRKGKRPITLRQLRDEVEADGLLMVYSRSDLPDLGEMRDKAGDRYARRKTERGLLD